MKLKLSKSKKKTQFVFMSIFAMVLLSFTMIQQTKWEAPASASKIKNPIANDAASVASGKKLYKNNCAVCHGNKGKGDGMAGGSLNPRPANFWKEAFQKQTDGAIYWKTTQGKGSMPKYKASLTDNQRWDIVNYMRTFKSK